MLKRNNRYGFTLIEMLVVIAVLGILAAIVIPRYAGTKEQAYKSKILSDLSSIDAALQLYFVDNNVWPSGAANLNFLSASGYIAAIPTPPQGVSISDIAVGVSYSYSAGASAYLPYRGVVSYNGWKTTSDAPLNTW